MLIHHHHSSCDTPPTLYSRLMKPAQWTVLSQDVMDKVGVGMNLQTLHFIPLGCWGGGGSPECILFYFFCLIGDPAGATERLRKENEKLH